MFLSNASMRGCPDTPNSNVIIFNLAGNESSKGCPDTPNSNVIILATLNLPSQAVVLIPLIQML